MDAPESTFLVKEIIMRIDIACLVSDYQLAFLSCTTYNKTHHLITFNCYFKSDYFCVSMSNKIYIMFNYESFFLL